MPAVTSILLGAGLALGAAGTGVQVAGQMQATKAANKAEKARQEAMNLDAQRKRRQVVREMQLARATALSNATSQGAAEGSGLQGGFGQISGEGNTNIVGINENQRLGNDIFAANRAAGKASTMTSMGSAMSSIGGTLIENRGEISRIGASLFA